jgi:hypothetical protein
LALLAELLTQILQALLQLFALGVARLFFGHAVDVLRTLL